MSNTFGGYEGPSIIESLETELLEASIKYLTLKDKGVPGWDNEGRTIDTVRGVVRGLAIAVAVWRNPYAQAVKDVEKEFIRLARTHVIKSDDEE